MEQGALPGALCIVDHDPRRAPLEELCESRLCQFFAGEDDCRCAFLPNAGEMRFATTRRTMHYERCAGPSRPPINPLDCRGIAVGHQEIRPVERRPVGQIEGELGHRQFDHAPREGTARAVITGPAPDAR